MDKFEWVKLSYFTQSRSRGASGVIGTKDILFITLLLGIFLPMLNGWANGSDNSSDASEIADQVTCRENQALLIPNQLLEIDGKSRAGDFIRKIAGIGNIILSAEGNIYYFPQKNFNGKDHVVFEFCREMECFEKEIHFQVDRKNPFKLRIVKVPKKLIAGIEKLEIKELEFSKNPVGLQIFNRWGNCVLDVADYRLSNDWNGTHSETGKTLASGKYFYVLSSSDENKFKKGFLELVEKVEKSLTN